MSNQENSDTQAAQEEVQDLNEEQLEGVTGAGLGGALRKVATCLGCGASPTVEGPRNPNPASSPEKHAIMQQLENAIDKSPLPAHWGPSNNKPYMGGRKKTM